MFVGIFPICLWQLTPPPAKTVMDSLYSNNGSYCILGCYVWCQVSKSSCLGGFHLTLSNFPYLCLNLCKKSLIILSLVILFYCHLFSSEFLTPKWQNKWKKWTTAKGGINSWCLSSLEIFLARGYQVLFLRANLNYIDIPSIYAVHVAFIYWIIDFLSLYIWVVISSTRVTINNNKMKGNICVYLLLDSFHI